MTFEESLLRNYLSIFCMSRNKINLNEETEVKLTLINDDTVDFESLSGENLGFLCLKQLDGNCNIALIYDVYLDNNETSKLILSYIEKICKKCGISLMMVTLNSEQEDLINLFSENNYENNTQFLSNRTKILNFLYTKEI